MADPVRITIDGKAATAQGTDTILAVAERLGIDIPTLCYMKGKKPGESCGICMVAIEGREGVVPACATRVRDGIHVLTNTETVRQVRRLAIELLLSDHLGDCLAPCELGCPAHIDIPRFIQSLREGRPRDAIETIKQSVAFPGVLGRICPRICESVCRRRDLDASVSISALKRFAADQDAKGESSHLPEKRPSTGKRVAIVGAGVAGLTAAYHLLVNGHECTVFDAQSEPGGGLRRIPEFRLPEKVIQRELAALEALGLQFRRNVTLGKDITLDRLRKDFDAVLLALGRLKEKMIEIPGRDLAVPSTEFLNRVSGGSSEYPGRNALVVGSGPAVLDLARVLVRLGAAQVNVAPDKDIGKGLTFRGQIDAAREEGVQILTAAEPKQIERLPDGGFRLLAEQEGREMTLEAERIYSAGELEPDLTLLQQLGIETTARGAKVHRDDLATNLQGVFAAGGVAGGGHFAVHASAAGRHAAESISHYLRGETACVKRPFHVGMHHLSEKEIENFYRDFARAPRVATRRVGPSEARMSFVEVDGGFSKSDALSEARRCLRCACAKKEDCRLRAYAAEYEADPHKYGGERQPFEREITHEHVVYEPAKCIKCGKCILIAGEAKESLGLTYIGRGFHVKVGVPFGETLKEGLKKVALECIAACPTGALARRRGGP